MGMATKYHMPSGAGGGGTLTGKTDPFVGTTGLTGDGIMGGAGDVTSTGEVVVGTGEGTGEGGDGSAPGEGG